MRSSERNSVTYGLGVFPRPAGRRRGAWGCFFLFMSRSTARQAPARIRPVRRGARGAAGLEIAGLRPRRGGDDPDAGQDHAAPRGRAGPRSRRGRSRPAGSPTGSEIAIMAAGSARPAASCHEDRDGIAVESQAERQERGRSRRSGRPRPAPTTACIASVAAASADTALLAQRHARGPPVRSRAGVHIADRIAERDRRHGDAPSARRPCSRKAAGRSARHADETRCRPRRRAAPSAAVRKGEMRQEPPPISGPEAGSSAQPGGDLAQRIGGEHVGIQPFSLPSTSQGATRRGARGDLARAARTTPSSASAAMAARLPRPTKGATHAASFMNRKPERPEQRAGQRSARSGRRLRNRRQGRHRAADQVDQRRNERLVGGRHRIVPQLTRPHPFQRLALRGDDIPPSAGRRRAASAGGSRDRRGWRR